MNSEPEDVGDAPQVEQKKQVRKSRRDGEIDNLKAILATYWGREFYWRLLCEGRVFHPTYCVGDSHATAYNEGKRQIGLWAMTELQLSSPDMYEKMRLEAIERERK